MLIYKNCVLAEPDGQGLRGGDGAEERQGGLDPPGPPDPPDPPDPPGPPGPPDPPEPTDLPDPCDPPEQTGSPDPLDPPDPPDPTEPPGIRHPIYQKLFFFSFVNKKKPGSCHRDIHFENLEYLVTIRENLIGLFHKSQISIYESMYPVQVYH
jgi:hypothetical protein